MVRFPNGDADGLIGFTNEFEIVVRSLSDEWAGELNFKEGSIYHEFREFATLGAFLRVAKSRDAAISAALNTPNALKLFAARLIGDDAFEQGRKAGRAELKAQIAMLDELK